MESISKLRDKTKELLLADFKLLQKEIIDAKLSHSLGKLKEVAKIAKIRKQIARIKTILREKEIIQS
ncbi:50S ribosomal protein L29 [Candidatus Parcubacteria bacterium]|nr:50S ribosomal protein L29 [Patescibacteria group bacterium]MBU4381144.1 50S ribosomal protein L29 [Patescibacteria group bacterium]MCG2689133.1 50S ribosomal protein L29 [Candidatus Parcubacteria bacterium]